ncbi:MAG: major capsid protein [Fusobacteriaceae bacterium]
MPGPILTFDRRVLNGFYKQEKPASTFLRRIFFPVTNMLDTPKVEKHFKKGKRRVAPFVSPKVGGKIYTNDGFDIHQQAIPTVGVCVKLSAEDEAFTIGLGQNPYAANPYAKVAEYLKDQSDMITRKEQIIIADLLTKGKFTVQEVGTDGSNAGTAYEVDFKMTNLFKAGEGEFADTKVWTDSTSNPIADLKKMRLAIWKNAGINPRNVVLSPDMATAFINHAKVKPYLDIKRIESGLIKPEVLEPGVLYLGYINELGMDIYEYQDWYLDETTGTDKEILPEGSVIMGTTGNEMLYGAVAIYDRKSDGTLGEPTVYKAERVADSWREGNKVRNLETMAKPLPYPTDIDGFAYLNLLPSPTVLTASEVENENDLDEENQEITKTGKAGKGK